jgi:perosamine synthetase
MILTAGPSISKKEIHYVTDAIKYGWGPKCYDYIKKFEKAFAKHIGVKYALATSGGTGALWLGLVALKIGKGDEVIMPELTYYACSDVIRLVGATPVFVDILEDTWCIDPDEVKKKITKAIMPTDIYGNACEMEELRKFGIPIIEDACEDVGGTYHGKPVGSMADVAAFSFQGAKTMVTGVGGMFTTNNKKLYERAEFINDHGESNRRKFWQEEIGYEFEMSNLQAALGLAQLERLDKLVAKKRKIFEWYDRRLKRYFEMNEETPNSKSTYWMSSIIYPFDRIWFMERLKKRGIDTRPFFYPISMFPMYKEQETPVAHWICLHGVNLPSGHNLTKKQVNYVCDQILDLI